ncbi:co-chaperone protein DjlA [Thalassotalea loyana]|uniref:Co-chaperone protein DjlA n=1 Tax=Thalassotalea loyana TaxID=280483 RepID=A0ABQ6H7B2_9GAMM|nr:co-chaperone DjlA [Thalassotalea loyana]GLX84026.1 co-chaperone protein DjlA [Thalassotalea loyana]
MKVWGKVFGFLFGFMLSKSIIGALLGLWLGHSFDRRRHLNFQFNSTSDELNSQAAFLYTTFSVMGHIAKAKGRVNEHEIKFASQYMDKIGLKGELRQQAQDAFREGKLAGFPLEQRIEKFKQSCKSRHDLILMFLEIQVQLALADGKLVAEEKEALGQIASLLGISSRELDRLIDMISAGAHFHSGHRDNARQPSSRQQLANAYKLLGVKKGSDKKEIKKAHRKLMSQHHPDKLVAKGLPPEMMDVAKQKAQEIQAAYDLIMEHI